MTEPKTIRIDHPHGDKHPDGKGFGFIVDDGSERSENPLYNMEPVANGTCPACRSEAATRSFASDEERTEHERQGGYIERCQKCYTDYFVRAL